jgi:hypothetical protein
VLFVTRETVSRDSEGIPQCIAAHARRRVPNWRYRVSEGYAAPADEARGRFDELTLLPTNAGVDAANERSMRTLFPWAPEEVFVAQDRRVPAGEDVSSYTQRLGLQARHKLRLRVGARVRLTRSLCGLLPGAEATVVRLQSVDIEVKTAAPQGVGTVKVVVQRVDHI